MTLKPAANTSPSAEEIQSFLPAYDSIELLAIGGMGAVYKARQISLDRAVAIKVLTHECSSAPQFRQIFKCEARVMAKLNHPNLVSIYDYGEENGLLYIVMQFVGGRSLHDAAHGKLVDPRESVALISKIGKALAYAHNSGILHRDIKPANILLDVEINPVVIDFGLAHDADESTRKGETVFGTPGYTAPEVLAPPYRADQRADVFSLGVILHELLTGQLPQSPYLPPSSLTVVDPQYDSIVMRAIHPTPDMRYNTAMDLAADLDHLLASEVRSTSSPLLTPVSHSELQQRVLITAAASTIAPVPATLPQPQEPNTIAQPKLAQSRTTSKATKMALAVCATAAMIITGFVISNTSSGPESRSRSTMDQSESPPLNSRSQRNGRKTEPIVSPGITANSM